MISRIDRRVDCVGLFCPLPVLRARQALEGMAPGQILELTADDPGAEDDVRRWVSGAGHQLLEIDKDGKLFRFVVRKAR